MIGRSKKPAPYVAIQPRSMDAMEIQTALNDLSQVMKDPTSASGKPFYETVDRALRRVRDRYPHVEGLTPEGVATKDGIPLEGFSALQNEFSQKVGALDESLARAGGSPEKARDAITQYGTKKSLDADRALDELASVSDQNAVRELEALNPDIPGPPRTPDFSGVLADQKRSPMRTEARDAIGEMEMGIPTDVQDLGGVPTTAPAPSPVAPTELAAESPVGSRPRAPKGALQELHDAAGVAAMERIRRAQDPVNVAAGGITSMPRMMIRSGLSRIDPLLRPLATGAPGTLAGRFGAEGQVSEPDQEAVMQWLLSTGQLNPERQQP